MEIQLCFETLELQQDASIQDVRQAYKDLVNIWHPDRIGDNPRLKKKAEEKLKDINLAYEELNSFLSSRQKIPPAVQKPSHEKPKPDVFSSADRIRTETKKAQKPSVEIQPKSNFFSSLRTLLSKVLEVLNVTQGSSNKPMHTRTKPFEPTGEQRQGRGMGKGMGRGKGMGGGGRGRGRRR
jgi:curved DNA-binding protein CbpA